MISRDFRDFIELLQANRVRYLVVGGYAVAVHGYPRYTKGLDIWIERSADVRPGCWRPWINSGLAPWG